MFPFDDRKTRKEPSLPDERTRYRASRLDKTYRCNGASFFVGSLVNPTRTLPRCVFGGSFTLFSALRVAIRCSPLQLSGQLKNQTMIYSPRTRSVARKNNKRSAVGVRVIESFSDLFVPFRFVPFRSVLLRSVLFGVRGIVDIHRLVFYLVASDSRAYRDRVPTPR